MIKIKEEFLKNLNYDSNELENLQIHKALKKADTKFLNCYKFNTHREIKNVYNYYYEYEHNVRYTDLHLELLAFWDVFKEYNSPFFARYSIVKICKILIIFNHIISSCRDEAFVYRELINSFGRYYDMLEYAE